MEFKSEQCIAHQRNMIGKEGLWTRSKENDTVSCGL